MKNNMLLSGRMIVSLQGLELEKIESEIIAHPMTLGVILFSKNFNPGDLQGLQKFIDTIQTIAKKAGKKQGIPLFIDQEGGHIQRFSRGFTALPAFETYGHTFDFNPTSGINLAKKYGEIMARELSTFGIISLTPLVDLNTGNPVISGLGRSFHQNPNICSQLASAFIDGMHIANMRATAKHFPGHGRANIGDSHLVEPIDDRSLETLESQDLIPFIHLIREKKIDAIMPAHITYPKIDPNHTAGTSNIWLKELLRKKYGFDGIIISDCLSMQGAGNDSYIKKTELALQYGDIALLCNTAPDIILDVLNQLDIYQATPIFHNRLTRWIGNHYG